MPNDIELIFLWGPRQRNDLFDKDDLGQLRRSGTIHYSLDRSHKRRWRSLSSRSLVDISETYLLSYEKSKVCRDGIERTGLSS